MFNLGNDMCFKSGGLAPKGPPPTWTNQNHSRMISASLTPGPAFR
jgi:hypothetical protein